MENNFKKINSGILFNCKPTLSSEEWNREFKKLELYIYSIISDDDGFSDEDFTRMKANAEKMR